MNTKITDKQFFLICLVLAAGIVALIYFLPYKKLSNSIDSLTSENNTVRDHVNSLQVYYDNQGQYAADTEVLKKEITNVLGAYPVAYTTEDFIMEAVSIENDTEIEYTSINIADKENLAVISQETIQSANIEGYTSEIDFVRQNVTYANKLDYFNLKDVIGDLFGSSYQSNIQSITYTCDEASGTLSGTIVVGYYSVFGTGKEYTYPTIPAYEPGTINIFGDYAPVNATGGAEGAEAGTETVNVADAGNVTGGTTISVTEGTHDNEVTTTTGGNTGSAGIDTNTSGGFFESYGK